MGLPEVSRFTIDGLVERWIEKYGKCSHRMVIDYVNNGLLLMSSSLVERFEHDIEMGKEKHVGTVKTQYFKLEDVLSFEANYPLNNTKNAILTDLHPKEKTSLLKLIAVFLGTSGYGYDTSQKKSPVPAEIHKEAELLNISIDVDTIRKWLKEAAEYLPPYENQED